MVTLVTVSVATPDLLSQTFLLVAAGLMIGMRARPTGWPAHALLGTALGLGYLANTAGSSFRRCALAMYALVHVEPRFPGAYVIIIGVALLASIRLPNAPWSGRLGEAVTIVFVVVALLPAALAVGYSVARDILRADDVRQESYVAEGLTRLGLQPGDPIGTIGFGATGWARLARVRVIVEVPWGEGPSLPERGPTYRRTGAGAFRSAGAKLALARDVPKHRSSGWIQIERTTCFYRILR